MKHWLALLERDTSVVEITSWNDVVLDLRYGRELYCGETRAFLHRDAAQKLQVFLDLLRKEHPGYKLVIWDATRPLFAQAALWDQVRGTNQMLYVSNPRKGSLHNYGMALDISVQKPDGTLIDMGTDFDDYSVRAAAKRSTEDSLVVQGMLTVRQVKNRRILRDLMMRSGFIQLTSEWWHFNAGGAAAVRASHQMLGVLDHEDTTVGLAN